jgi:hypothetical protein
MFSYPQVSPFASAVSFAFLKSSESEVLPSSKYDLLVGIPNGQHFDIRKSEANPTCLDVLGTNSCIARWLSHGGSELPKQR